MIKVCSTCKHVPIDEHCKECRYDLTTDGNTRWEPSEEFINTLCASEQAFHEDKMNVLEKIRDEIERRGGNDEKSFCKSLNESYKLGLREAIEIIDKHMAEREDEE